MRCPASRPQSRQGLRPRADRTKGAKCLSPGWEQVGDNSGGESDGASASYELIRGSFGRCGSQPRSSIERTSGCGERRVSSRRSGASGPWWDRERGAPSPGRAPCRRALGRARNAGPGISTRRGRGLMTRGVRADRVGFESPNHRPQGWCTERRSSKGDRPLACEPRPALRLPSARRSFGFGWRADEPLAPAVTLATRESGDRRSCSRIVEIAEVAERRPVQVERPRV